MKIKVNGIAGTGKTNYLIKTMLEHTKNVREVGFICFSKRARWNAIQRMLSMGFRNEDIKYFRTFHSIASELLELKEENFVKPEHKKDFLKTYYKNIEYNCEGMETDEENGVILPETFGNEKALGNWLFNFDTYCKMIKKDIEIPNKILEKWNITEKFVKEFREKWAEYKSANRLYDYVDCIEWCIKNKAIPDIKILIVDEFQDISPLVYDLYSMWAERMSLVFIGGDPYQNVFKFAGANEQYFINEPADKVVNLEINYRIPEKILRYAEYVLNKKINCKSVIDGGKIEFVTNKEELFTILKETYERKKESAQVLFRFKYLLREFSGELNNRMIPHTIWGGSSIWTERFLNIYEALYRLKHNEPINLNICYALVSSIPSKGNLKHGIKTEIEKRRKQNPNTEITPNEFYEMFTMNMKPTLNEIVNILSDVSHIQKSVIMNMLVSDVPPIKYEDIRVHLSTITSAKGGETEIVIVSNNITYDLSNSILENPSVEEDERNIFYTAVTRAKERLIIADGVFNGPVFLPLSQSY